MEEIIKILEEHNIKCVQDGNDLSLSHKNFYINVENVIESKIINSKMISFHNDVIIVTVYYTLEYIHVTVL